MSDMRKALVIGINDYPDNPLNCCVNDAIIISGLLGKNDNGTKNFDVCIESDIKTKSRLKGKIKELFNGENDVELFYYSGHGYVDTLGGYIVTPDYCEDDWGVSMNEILQLANQSSSMNKIIILDCCFSGAMGQSNIDKNISPIGNGVTILTSSRSSETSMEINGHGIFTHLLIQALQGGAANLLGKITPGSIYAYIDQALGSWGQRPIFKTNITRFISVRDTLPHVKIEELAVLKDCFSTRNEYFSLDPSFEFTNSIDEQHVVIEPYANPDNVRLFKILQKLESVDLVKPVGENHMYFAAMHSKACKLTPLGQYYWELLNKNRI